VPSGALAPAEAVFQDSDDDAAPSDDDLDESNPVRRPSRAAPAALPQPRLGNPHWRQHSSAARRVCLATAPAAFGGPQRPRRRLRRGRTAMAFLGGLAVGCVGLAAVEASVAVLSRATEEKALARDGPAPHARTRA
jgi:hypothetical protein